MVMRVLDFKFKPAPTWLLVLLFPGCVILAFFSMLIFTAGEVSDRHT